MARWVRKQPFDWSTRPPRAVNVDSDFRQFFEWRLLGELLPYEQGRSDRQFTRDPAVGDNAGLA